MHKITHNKMNQSPAKWIGTAAFFMLLWNVKYNSTNCIRSILRKDSTNRMLTEKSHEAKGNVDSLQDNTSRLNFMSYREPDRCDFSEFVQKFRPEQLEINCDNIHRVKLRKLLGHGALRHTYEAKWQGKNVAVKVIHKHSKKFVKQITLAAAVHFQLREASNFVHILGWCNSTIVLEKAMGNLLVAINHQMFSVERALQLSLDIVKGVQQLHTLPGGPVTHGDIKLSQFLFDNQGKLHLSDLDRMHYTGYSNTNEKCKFIFNDVHNDDCGPFDEKFDINSTARVLQQLRRNSVKEETSKYPQAMNNLIDEAFNNDPAMRPSATSMVQRMSAILRDYIASHVHS